jgi:hypothetical protein
MTPAPARSRGRTQVRTTVAPRGPRRVSGPVTRRAVAAPVPQPSPGRLPRRGAAPDLPRSPLHGLRLGRVRALPERRVVDRLLRSRLWIWTLGVLLGGIVAMQVSLLKLNSGISRAVTTTTTLERQNARLEAAIGRLGATDRIERGAASLNMVMPPAGDVSYLTARPDDAGRAVRRMRPPSEEAAALMTNRGIVPGSLADVTADAAAASPAAATGPVATTTTAAATTVAPATTTVPATAAATPAPTPAPSATPAPASTAPAAATAPAVGSAGGVAAAQG